MKDDLRKEENSIALPGERNKRRKIPIEGGREKTLSKTEDEKIFYYKYNLNFTCCYFLFLF